MSVIRNAYLVTYDVSDDKRLRRTYRCLLGYGDPVQYSVFRCELSAKEQVLMISDLSEIIHHGEDQVMVINLGPSNGRAADCTEVLGRPSPPPARGVVVV